MSLDDSNFRTFEIELRNGNDVVIHDGQEISGFIKIELKIPLKLKAVKIEFKGRAAHITEGSRDTKVYVDHSFNLLDRVPGQPLPGSFEWINDYLYSLPFQFLLPAGCPTSYEGPDGYIRYYLRCTIIFDDAQKSEFVIKKGLSVVSLTTDSVVFDDAATPISDSENALFGKCCCRGKLSVDVQLLKSIYYPGEEVIGMLKINNRHPRHIIHQVDVYLVDATTRAGTSTLHKGRVLVRRKLDKPDIKPKTVLEKSDIVFLQIPPLAPTVPLPISPLSGDSLTKEEATSTLSFRKKPFLRIDYEIQVAVSDKLLLRLPITIAPLRIKGVNVNYRPFVGGAQNIREDDEKGKVRLGDGFDFTPYYPIINDHSSTVTSAQTINTLSADVTADLNNCN